MVDLNYLREQREAQIKQNKYKLRIAEELKDEELNLTEKNDITLVVSSYEKDIIKKERPGINVEVLSNIHEVYRKVKSFQQRKNIMFIGALKHKPNIDAVLFFVNEIIPNVREKLNGLITYIIGSNPTEEIKALACNDIIVIGFVPNVAPFFNDCRISVAPLLWGAGVKGKINQSISYGLPVVATPVAIEGMSLTDEVDVLVASDAKCFADKIVELYKNEELWNKLSYNGLENIRKHFSFEIARNKIEQVFNCSNKYINSTIVKY